MRSTRIRLVLALIASGFAFLIILACGGAAATTPPQVVSGSVTSVQESKHFKVGQQVKVGTWQWNRRSG